MFQINAVGVNQQEVNFRDNLEAEYQEKIREIAAQVRGRGSFVIKGDVCKRLYDWFIRNVSYDNAVLKNKRPDGKYMPVEYNYRGSVIRSSEKYAAILLLRGDCSALSHAFKDVCDILEIGCRVVSGFNNPDVLLSTYRIAHSWNEVTIDGKRSTVDLDPHFRTFMTPPRTTIAHNRGK